MDIFSGRRKNYERMYLIILTRPFVPPFVDTGSRSKEDVSIQTLINSIEKAKYVERRKRREMKINI